VRRLRRLFQYFWKGAKVNGQRDRGRAGMDFTGARHARLSDGLLGMDDVSRKPSRSRRDLESANSSDDNNTEPVLRPFSGESEVSEADGCDEGGCPGFFMGLILGPLALLCVVCGFERKLGNVFAILIGAFLSTTVTIIAMGVALSNKSC
jgi:hypothetical protein